jgi:cytochrome c oxidase subunit IV
MAETPTPTQQPHAAPHHGPTPKEYIRIGLVLAVLTGFEIYMSYSGVHGSALIAILIGAAILKFVLVVSYYMHLKYDDRRYARFFVMGIVGAATLYLIVLMLTRVFVR